MKSPPPNLLFICSDQHSARVLGAYGDRAVATPHLDGLAAGGCRFDSCYCNGPLCAPSRMSFMTGRFPFRCEVTGNGHVLDSRYPTLAHIAVRGGRHAVLAGRMHFFGPDQRHGFLERLVGEPFSYAVYHGADRLPAGLSLFDLGNCYLPDPLRHVGPGENPYVAYDRAVADASVGWLRQYARDRTRRKPFFMLTGFMLPHCPFIAPPGLFAKYEPRVRAPRLTAAELNALHPYHQAYRRLIKLDEAPDANLDRAAAAYYALVEELDQNIGRLLETLKSTELWDNTIVVYFSDHGEMLGRHGRWHKDCFYEDASHVPLIVRHPDLKSGATVAEHRSLVDLLPTVADWSGVANPPGVDGASLVPVLTGGGESAHRIVRAETYTHTPKAGGLPAIDSNRMVRRGPWKLCYYGGYDSFELFNLADDPEERINLVNAPAHAAVVRELVPLIFADGWSREVGRHIDDRLRAIGYWDNLGDFEKALKRDPAGVDALDYWRAIAATRASVDA